MKQRVDKFGVKRNLCKCGKIALWWDGKKSMCYECLERQGDLKRGYAIDASALGYHIISLEEKYGKEGKNEKSISQNNR